MNNPLLKWSDLTSRSLHATDGEIGRVKDVLFDDTDNSVRYFVVRTGPWLVGQETLISPEAIGATESSADFVPVNITKDQVRQAPPYESHKPVTRQFEQEYYHYYGYPPYWGGAVVGPEIATAAIPPHAPQGPMIEHMAPAGGDPHLWSCKEIRKYSVMSDGKDVGFIDDFVFEGHKWKLRHLIVETSLWPGAEKYLLPCEVIRSMNVSSETIDVPLSIEEIEKAPRLSADDDIDREYEDDLYSQLKVVPYWQKAEGGLHKNSPTMSPSQR